MYTIIMNDDKSLTNSVRTTLYQHEKLADQIQILTPQKCGLVDLNECTVKMIYIDQGNISRSERLAKDTELYKNKLRFVLPVDSKLNYFSGNVIIHLVFTKINPQTGKYDQVLRTGDCLITIQPSKIVDNSIEAYDKIYELEAQIEELKKNQPNDLKLTDDLLQLTADDKVIGDGVVIPKVSGDSDDEDGDPVIDFDTPSGSGSGSDDDNEEDGNKVIEF